MLSRSPCGERGLKFSSENFAIYLSATSLPMRGAWIEIFDWMPYAEKLPSLPMRGAWIEMIFTGRFLRISAVAPHAGSVD